MSTVNNVFLPNVPKESGGEDLWPHYWALQRAMWKSGWKATSFGNDSAKVTSDDPGTTNWGTMVISNAGAAAASTGAIAEGRMTVTGLTGIVAGDKGRFLVMSGAASAGNNHYHQIEEIISGTEVRVDARRTAFTPVATDANNGSITWEIRDPTLTVQPFVIGQECWVTMEGPSTLKIPITSAPTPGASFNFIRGENVVQATTGAEGEIRGWVFDSVSAGYLVISPRKRGTGAGVFGWDTANVVTGDTSGATATQVGTAIAYTQQVVLRKDSNWTGGHLYIQCVDKVGETAEDFDTLANSAGATGTGSTVQPGGGGTGNAFPAHAYTLQGAADTSSGLVWSMFSTAHTYGTGQIIAMDAIEEVGYSASGSWAVFSANISLGGLQGHFLCIADDGEAGDLDPYVGFTGNCKNTWNNSTEIANARTATTTAFSVINGGDFFTTEELDNTMSKAHSPFRGWRNRGLSIAGHADEFMVFEPLVLYAAQSNGPMLEIQTGDAMRYSTDPNATRAKIREPVRIGSTSSGQKMFKGTLRQFSIVQGGTLLDTYDGGKHVQLSGRNGAWVWTPWDEVTVPSAS